MIFDVFSEIKGVFRSPLVSIKTPKISPMLLFFPYLFESEGKPWVLASGCKGLILLSFVYSSHLTRLKFAVKTEIRFFWQRKRFIDRNRHQFPHRV